MFCKCLWKPSPLVLISQFIHKPSKDLDLLGIFSNSHWINLRMRYLFWILGKLKKIKLQFFFQSYVYFEVITFIRKKFNVNKMLSPLQVAINSPVIHQHKDSISPKLCVWRYLLNKEREKKKSIKLSAVLEARSMANASNLILMAGLYQRRSGINDTGMCWATDHNKCLYCTRVTCWLVV